MVQSRKSGRPPIKSEVEILRAALAAFARNGYEATSVRSLNGELGLSHETIGQRFGTKLDLYFAALDFGIAEFFEATIAIRSARPNPDNDLEALRETLRIFMTVAADHPELGQLIQQEGLRPSERLDYLVQRGFEPGTAFLGSLLRRLIARREIRPTSIREVFFLSQAGGAPFALSALSTAFDNAAGPLDPVSYIENITDIIMAGLRRVP